MIGSRTATTSKTFLASGTMLVSSELLDLDNQTIDELFKFESQFYLEEKWQFTSCPKGQLSVR